MSNKQFSLLDDSDYKAIATEMTEELEGTAGTIP